LSGTALGRTAAPLGAPAAPNGDGWTWVVDFGRDMLLLPALDRLLSLAGFRAAAEARGPVEWQEAGSSSRRRRSASASAERAACAALTPLTPASRNSAYGA
jgi:hypothetical protein